MKPSLAQLFGERLREMRQKRQLTQVELSAIVRIPQARISELERGTRTPNLETILRLAVALECKPTDLVSVFNRPDLGTILRK